ncbi:MAG: hypothetical protein WCJ40_09240 [Planctomycetota bacterium]
MLLKKLFFLVIPIIVVYWRSRTAQTATNWLFRGVLPKDGPLGQVFSEFSKTTQPSPTNPSAHPNQSAHPQAVKADKPKPKTIAATIANQWPVLLAFLAGICLAGLLFSNGSGRN